MKVQSQFIEMFAFQDLSLTNPSDDFGKKCYDDTSSATKVPAGDYQNKGRYAIYDQSQDCDIAGYTDSIEGVCNNYPAVLFGDHSRVIKYINQPFYIGADGVKIIRPKEDDLLPEFLYYDLLYHNIPNTGYNRHFKYVKMFKLTEVSIDEQKEFLKIAHQADKSKFVGFKSQFIEMFGDPVSWQTDTSLPTLNDTVNVISGFPFDSEKFDTEGVGTPLIRIRDIQRGYSETFTTEVFDEQYRIKKYELLVGMDGMFDIARWQSDEAALNQRVCCLRMKGSENDTFIQYLVQPILKHIENGTNATTVKHISTKQINGIRVPIASHEQKNKFAMIANQADKSKYYYQIA